MDETRFTPILRELVRRVPGAYAVALVDSEGETVDYAGLAPAYDVRVAAAYVQLLLRQVDEAAALGTARWIVIRGSARSVVVRALPDGYALGLLLRKRAGFNPSRRALAACEGALSAEAGWKRAPNRETRADRWHAVSVEADRRGRPLRLGAQGLSVEILGSIVGLPRSERGFRVRIASGTELTLVREARNCWYADEAEGEDRRDNSSTSRSERAVTTSSAKDG